jgi:hypothetical protein
MTRRNGRHPGAVPLDARSLEAMAMLQGRRERWCPTCGPEGQLHIEELCVSCTRANPNGTPVYHLAE